MSDLTSVTLGQWKLWDGPQYHGLCLGVCVSVALVMGVCVYYYFVKVADRCTCATRLDGKTVVITGKAKPFRFPPFSILSPFVLYLKKSF